MHQTHFCKKGENYLYYKKKDHGLLQNDLI